jgi:hypothetical protein
MGCLMFVRHTVVQGATESGDIQLSGLVPGSPPSVPAVIQQPINGQQFTANTVTIEGTCDHDFIVELYRNGDLAGSVVCSPTGTFSLIVTLITGSNALVARTRDVISQYGPDSTTTTVFYDAPVLNPTDPQTPGTNSPNPPNTGTVGQAPADLLVTSKGYFRVDQVKKEARVSFTIVGGQGPYSVLIRWGDGRQTTRVYDEAGEYTLTRQYDKPGQYRVIIEVTDINGSKVIFQTVVIVDGVKEVNLSSTGTLSQRCQQDAVCIFQNQLVDGVNRAYPVFVVVSILTLCFWLGERVAIHSINKKAVH